MEPVYPKQDPEYRKRVLEQFYKSVRNTKWPTEEEKTCKRKGRKPKPSVRIETKPRSESEAKVVGQKYNWFN